MITTHKIPCGDGELRIGWASWDDGSMTERSIKYAYKDKSGKISRGSPELPFDILTDMFSWAVRQGELTFGRGKPNPSPAADTSTKILKEEDETLKNALLVLQKMQSELPWADMKDAYDTIGKRYEDVQHELARRTKRTR